MRIKTSELIGPALDWAVALCEDRTFSSLASSKHHFAPSRLWAQSGQIIEREGISLLYLYVTDDPFRWAATQKPSIRNVKPESLYGPTPLIAAMRCYVSSKLGDEVDVPNLA